LCLPTVGKNQAMWLSCVLVFYLPDYNEML
jgi:hypothetical protein